MVGNPGGFWAQMSWIIEPEQEHRYIVARTLSWVSYLLGVRDFLFWQVLVFWVNISLVATLGYLICQTTRSWERAFALTSLIFLFSTSLSNNHLWPTLISISLCYHFSLWASYHLLFTKRFVLGILLSWISILSDSNGLPIFLMLGLAVLILETGWKRRIFRSIAVLLAPALYACMYQAPSRPTPQANPWEQEYWLYLGKLLSFTFGYDNTHFMTIALSYGIFGILFLGFFCKNRSSDFNFYLAIIASLVLPLTLVSYLRGGEWQAFGGYIHKRYNLFAIVLLPWVYFCWLRLWNEWMGKKIAILMCLLLVAFTFRGYLHHWDFGVYVKNQEFRQSIVKCLRYNIDTAQTGDCPVFELGPDGKNNFYYDSLQRVERKGYRAI